MLAYYLDRSSPLLLNIGSRGVTGAAAYVVTTHRAGSGAAAHGRPAPLARVGGHWELGAAASRKAVWWDLCLASLLTHLFSCLSRFGMEKFANVRLPVSSSNQQ